MINYTPFGHSDWQDIVSQIKSFGSLGKKTAVVSTINGDANVPFYKELGNQGIKATDIPVVAFSVGEEELAGIDTKPLVGHLAAWNYFESVDTPAKRPVHQRLARSSPRTPKRMTNDPMEGALHRLQHVGEGGREGEYHGSGRGDRRDDRRRRAEPDRRLPTMMPNHHITKPVLIGEIQGDGQFNVVSQTPGTVVAQRLVAVSAGKQGPDRRLAAANVLRKLRRGSGQVPQR